MKVKRIENVEAFLDKVSECEGTVELVTNQGDRLNLKSQLTRYVALANVFSTDALIEDIEIVCYNPEDTKKLLEFMINA